MPSTAAFGDRYLVVTALAYESSWSYLIDRRGGVVHKIVAIPVLSADEDFAVAASVSLVDMAVEVIAFEASGPVLEHVEIDESCSLEPSPADMALEWEPVRLGPDVIELRSESEPDPGALLTRLERRDARWRAVCSRK